MFLLRDFLRWGGWRGEWWLRHLLAFEESVVIALERCYVFVDFAHGFAEFSDNLDVVRGYWILNRWSESCLLLYSFQVLLSSLGRIFRSQSFRNLRSQTLLPFSSNSLLILLILLCSLYLLLLILLLPRIIKRNSHLLERLS